MPAERAPGPDGSSSRSTRRRRAALGAAALLAAGVVLVAFLWPRGDAGGASRTPPSAPTPPSPVQAGVGASDGTPPTEELPESVQRYLEATVYPPTSGRLTRGDVDLLHPNQRYEQPRPVYSTISDDAAGVVRYLLTADRYHLEAGETAHATLEAWRGRTPIPTRLEVREATLVAEGCAGEEGQPVPVHFGLRGDRLEADLPFTAFDRHHGSVLLEVTFTWDDDAEPQREELRFFHTPQGRIPAEIVPGSFRDGVHEGSLRLELGVDVRDPGFYRFDANVFGPDGTPVAFAAFKGNLGTGLQTVPLDVYGKILRDAGIPGPYQVSEVRGYRFLDGKCPDRENLPAQALRFTTAPYALDAFTDEPHMSAHKQHMIEMMRADHEKGIGPEFPELPPAGGEVPPSPLDDDYEPPPPPGPQPPRGS